MGHDMSYKQTYSRHSTHISTTVALCMKWRRSGTRRRRAVHKDRLLTWLSRDFTDRDWRDLRTVHVRPNPVTRARLQLIWMTLYCRANDDRRRNRAINNLRRWRRREQGGRGPTGKCFIDGGVVADQMIVVYGVCWNTNNDDKRHSVVDQRLTYMSLRDHGPTVKSTKDCAARIRFTYVANFCCINCPLFALLIWIFKSWKF